MADTIGKKNNETAIYEMLFRDYYAPMVLYADKSLKDRQLAEDVVQDVFSRLIQKGRDFELGNKTKHLLFTMLRNQVIDVIRQNKRRKLEPVKETPDEFSIEDAVFEIELYQRLYKAVETLPRKNRCVMQMKLQGMSDAEIAESLGIGYETVRSHVKNGIISLRGKFSDSLLIILFLL